MNLYCNKYTMKFYSKQQVILWLPVIQSFKIWWLTNFRFYINNMYLWSWSSVVGIATRLWARQSRVRILAEAIVFYFPTHLDKLCSSPSLLLNGYQSSIMEVKQPGCKVNHSPPFSAEIKKEWSYTCSSPVSLHGVTRENFTFYYAPSAFLYLAA